MLSLLSIYVVICDRPVYGQVEFYKVKVHSFIYLHEQTDHHKQERGQREIMSGSSYINVTMYNNSFSNAWNAFVFISFKHETLVHSSWTSRSSSLIMLLQGACYSSFLFNRMSLQKCLILKVTEKKGKMKSCRIKWPNCCPAPILSLP